MEEKQQMNFTHQHVSFSAWPKLAFFYRSDSVLTLTYVNACMYPYFYGMYVTNADFWTGDSNMYVWKPETMLTFCIVAGGPSIVAFASSEHGPCEATFFSPICYSDTWEHYERRSPPHGQGFCIVPGPLRLARLASRCALRGLPAATALSFLSWLIQLYHSRSSPGRESWYPGPQLSINYMAHRGSFSTGVNCIRPACCTSSGFGSGSFGARRRGGAAQIRGLRWAYAPVPEFWLLMWRWCMRLEEAEGGAANRNSGELYRD